MYVCGTKYNPVVIEKIDPTVTARSKFHAKSSVFFDGGQIRYKPQIRPKALTFFSLSSHLLMAKTEEPVRSLRAAIASLT